jgi:hypothetical protein
VTRWPGVLALAVLTAACASPAPTTPVIDVGESDLIFRVTQSGGLPPPPELRVLDDPPLISVFGDGRMIRISSAPVLGDRQVPALVLAHAATEQLEMLVATAQRNDLLRDVRYDCPGAFDFPTTVLRSAVADQAHAYEVYALGSDGCEGLSPEAVIGRQNLVGFVELLRGLDRAGEIDWSPDRLLVVVSRRAVGDGEQAKEVPWPLADGPAEIGEPADPDSGWERCAILGPGETAILWPALQAAVTTTRFTRDGESWWVDGRPLLPDEQGACPLGQ